MRVMIWADVEGVAGINVWEQTGGKLPLYEDGRRLYTEEINAAVRGCRTGGAAEIVVVDGHGGGYEGGRGFMTLIPDRLESGARYVLGHPWARYIEPLEQGCDAVVFVGAHAKTAALRSAGDLSGRARDTRSRGGVHGPHTGRNCRTRTVRATGQNFWEAWDAIWYRN